MAIAGYREIKGKRSVFGHMVLWSFLGFNVLMLMWLIGGVHMMTEGYDQMSPAEQSGTVIGIGFGVFRVFVTWVIGCVILGIPLFLTRPSKTMVPFDE